MREHDVRALDNVKRLAIAQPVRLPYSEVCMHMRVAGTMLPVIPLDSGMAQLLNLDGSLLSMPVTAGEAGVQRVEVPVTIGGEA